MNLKQNFFQETTSYEASDQKALQVLVLQQKLLPKATPQKTHNV